MFTLCAANRPTLKISSVDPSTKEERLEAGRMGYNGNTYDAVRRRYLGGVICLVQGYRSDSLPSRNLFDLACGQPYFHSYPQFQAATNAFWLAESLGRIALINSELAAGN